MGLAITRRRWALAAALGLLALSSGAVETVETYRASWGAYLQGRLEDAASGYRYLATLGEGGAEASVNLALMARDQGKEDEALAHWVKATLLEPYDSFLWSQRGWSSLALRRYRDARDSFKKAIETSSITYQTAEARFGLGLTEQLDGNDKAAIAAYSIAYTHSPYLLPAVSAQMGRLASRRKRDSTAELYFKQSLSQDPKQLETILELARIYERNGSPKAAWQGYKLALDLDSSDPAAQAGFSRTEAFLLERAEKVLPVRRLVSPLMTHFSQPPASPSVRVGLFSNPEGLSAQLTRFYCISGSGFKLVDTRLGEIARSRPLDQWEVSFRPETRVIEVRDAHRELKFTTKQNFRIEPIHPGATVLVKSAALVDIKGVDIGDREMRGAVEGVPSPQGFQLVNELGLEDYLSSRISALLPSGAPPEALKAEAVLARTQLAGLPAAAHHSFLRTDLCDSTHCHVYPGISQENLAARRAVIDTRGIKVSLGAGWLPLQHVSCGFATEETPDRPKPHPPLLAPSELERRIHSYPGSDLYCEASALAQPAWSRWVRLLEAQWIRDRIERGQELGPLRGLRVLERSPSGRAKALEIIGAYRTIKLEGAAAIEKALSPGGIRSMLFTVQPIYRSKNIEYLLIWGAGTGSGQGLCNAGAMGQAHLGRSYRDILKFYFPNASFPQLPGASARAVRKERATRALGSPASKTEIGGPSLKERDRARRRRAARLRAAQKARAEKKGE